MPSNKRSSSSSRSRSSSRGRTASKSQVTTDHDEIQKWVEKRNGKPACVKGTGGRGDAGVLRIDYPGYSGEETLQPMDWSEWFEKFDEANLAFLYQEQTSKGAPSRFSKLVNRKSADSGASGRHGRSAR